MLLEFKPIYYGERLKVVNPTGDVGICTLWSKPESAYEVITGLGVDTSRIAIVANLYGNGLPHMLRNLLYNPQIRYIFILGKNLSGSREWLLNFFEHGLEEVDFLGAKAFRIKETNRTIDGLVLPSQFKQKISFFTSGDLRADGTKGDLTSFFNSIPPQEECSEERFEPPPIPEPEVSRYPSEARSHSVRRESVMECWLELIFRLHRFGHRNVVAKSTGPEGRIELQNFKVVVQNPVEESDEVLQRFGFSLEKFQAYQERILDPAEVKDLSYTYGNRLRSYFGIDGLTTVSCMLKDNSDSRHAYRVLWDPTKEKDKPCLVTIFFRRFEGKLTLSATFRTHNAMDAWPENLYGLIAIQRFVSDSCGIEPGPITTVSHSISIDVVKLSDAARIAKWRESDENVDLLTGGRELRFDPNGNFVVTFDPNTWELVVEHIFDGQKLNEYRGKTPEEIERQLSRDIAISEISHALYVGRQITLKAIEMKAAKISSSK